MTLPTGAAGGISIHAPRVGSDPGHAAIRRKLQNFNPRSPCGERLDGNVWSPDAYPFQSTLPVWGATSSGGIICTNRRFQSTLPVWGATPGAGQQNAGAAPISIHAPRVGSDRAGTTGRSWTAYFNPRSPCGERRWRAAPSTGTENFNPRSPCGERPDLRVIVPIPVQISIHAPRVGSDTSGESRLSQPMKISIHAPRVGSDISYCVMGPCSEQFQSTLPVWGATPPAFPGPRPPGTISIHAPRVGSDDEELAQFFGEVIFQSTLPVWGATLFLSL